VSSLAIEELERSPLEGHSVKDLTGTQESPCKYCRPEEGARKSLLVFVPGEANGSLCCHEAHLVGLLDELAKRALDEKRFEHKGCNMTACVSVAIARVYYEIFGDAREAEKRLREAGLNEDCAMFTDIFIDDLRRRFLSTKTIVECRDILERITQRSLDEQDRVRSHFEFSLNNKDAIRVMFSSVFSNSKGAEFSEKTFINLQEFILGLSLHDKLKEHLLFCLKVSYIGFLLISGDEATDYKDIFQRADTLGKYVCVNAFPLLFGSLSTLAECKSMLGRCRPFVRDDMGKGFCLVYSFMERALILEHDSKKINEVLGFSIQQAKSLDPDNPWRVEQGDIIYYPLVEHFFRERVGKVRSLEELIILFHKCKSILFEDTRLGHSWDRDRIFVRVLGCYFDKLIEFEELNEAVSRVMLLSEEIDEKSSHELTSFKIVLGMRYFRAALNKLEDANDWREVFDKTIEFMPEERIPQDKGCLMNAFQRSADYYVHWKASRIGVDKLFTEVLEEAKFIGSDPVVDQAWLMQLLAESSYKWLMLHYKIPELTEAMGKDGAAVRRLLEVEPIL
tara:strand:+ start:1748 stop:3439 length:1692 start_codon:yes stop_codon:yes gene_type:complete